MEPSLEPTPDDALLTAYLDGELSLQERQHLEQRLANEPELRQRLALLEETRLCLDLLEQESVDAEQIETTLKIAAVSVSAFPFAAPRASCSGASRRGVSRLGANPFGVSRFGRWGIATLAGMMLFFVAFQFGKQSPFDDPSFRQKIERLDMYRAILDDGGIELLRQLAMERVFLPPLPGEFSPNDFSPNDFSPSDLPPVAPHEYKPSPRSWFFSALIPSIVSDRHEWDNAGVYQLLSRNIQTYNRLPPETTRQIRRLHRDIEAAPRRAELLLTLHNYYHWFKSLQRYEQFELREPRSIEGKVAAIIDLKIRLDNWDALPSMPSEIVGIEESRRLAETLTELAPWHKVRLLNEEPIRIINELNQASFR